VTKVLRKFTIEYRNDLHKDSQNQLPDMAHLQPSKSMFNNSDTLNQPTTITENDANFNENDTTRDSSDPDK
jgi:hypothetical protein